MTASDDIDVVVIGSGMGGASFAAGLAPSGARILILERGERLVDRPETRDGRAIYQRGVFRPKETWFDAAGAAFNPGNYYYVGGNTKLYGAVLIRYRAQDFAPIQYAEGADAGLAVRLRRIRAVVRARRSALSGARQPRRRPDRARPFHPLSLPPVPDEPAIAAVRERLASAGMHPFSLPLGVDIDRWLARAKTPWDGFPDTDTGKMDAETCGLKAALAHDNVAMETGARVVRLETDSAGKRIEAVVYESRGETRRLTPKARRARRRRRQFRAAAARLSQWRDAAPASPIAPIRSGGIS